MAITRRFVVMKDAKTETITYSEYEKLKGYNVKPKDSLNIEDMINVNEMVIINPTLIEKLVDKKCKRTFDKILSMLSFIDEDDSDDEAPLHLVLDEVEKFYVLARKKYKDYMEKEEYKLLIKKIEILEKEVRLRLEAKRYNLSDEPLKEKRGKGGR